MADVWLTLILLFSLMFVGVPVAIAIGAAAFLGLWMSGVPLLVIPQRMIAGIDSFSLLAVPLFLVMGGLLTASGLTQRLITFAEGLVGWLRGGLGAVNVTGNMIMGGMTGSALAEASMTGSIMIPSMKKAGYGAGYSSALTGSSSIVGPLIPPSIPFIVYGSVFGVSIGQLFLGGLLPGILVGMLLLIANYIYAKRHGIAGLKIEFARWWRETVKAIPVLFTSVLILGGIFGGIFTPTESAAAGVLYVLVIAMILYRSLGIWQIAVEFAEAAYATAILFAIIAVSSAYGWYLARSEVGTLVLSLFAPIQHSEILTLLVINLVLLLFGCFLETYAVLFLIIPLLLPLVTKLGIDPVHFGVLVVLNLNIGLVTPPFGMCMFIGNQIAGCTMREFARALLYLLPALLTALFLVTYVPAITLWLPTLLAR
jgi:tripartite ATP-independent transporter DctM subunit